MSKSGYLTSLIFQKWLITFVDNQGLMFLKTTLTNKTNTYIGIYKLIDSNICIIKSIGKNWFYWFWIFYSKSLLYTRHLTACCKKSGGS